MGLVKILNDSDNHTIFATAFVDNLLKQFWGQYQTRLIYRMLLPFLGYYVTTITTMSLYLSRYTEPGAGIEQLHIQVVGSISGALWIYQLYLECIQLANGRPRCKNIKDQAKGYFTQFWNFNDLFHLTLTGTFIFLSVQEKYNLPMNYMSLIAAFNALSISLKCFDWLRLVEKTAFYINLIGQTIADISSFIILLLASFLLFGLPMMMLNYYSNMEMSLFQDKTNNLVTLCCNFRKTSAPVYISWHQNQFISYCYTRETHLILQIGIRPSYLDN